MRVALAVFFAALFLSPIAYAQLTLPGASSAATITLEPAHPAPGDTVSLSLTSPLYDLSSSVITWRVGGATVKSGVGETQLSLTAGKLGETTLVTADLTGENTAEATAAITPSIVDVLWEADSFVPPFYVDRALPSAGSRIRVQAVPLLPKRGGGFYPADQLQYAWRVDGALIKNASGKGKASAILSGPELFGAETVSVEVTSADGITGGGVVRVTSLEPQLRLYEDHPLFGIEYWHALATNEFVGEAEMTFAATPYFASVPGPDDPNLDYGWTVNGRTIDADQSHPSEITINAGSSGGIALIDVLVTHAKNLLLQSEGKWSVTFTSAGAGNAGTIVKDLFHGSQ